MIINNKYKKKIKLLKNFLSEIVKKSFQLIIKQTIMILIWKMMNKFYQCSLLKKLMIMNKIFMNYHKKLDFYKII